MRIGIDATALPSEPVGAGTYMIQLIRALTGLETEHELVIFAQRPVGRADQGKKGRILGDGQQRPGTEGITSGRPIERKQ